MAHTPEQSKEREREREREREEGERERETEKERAIEAAKRLPLLWPAALFTLARGVGCSG